MLLPVPRKAYCDIFVSYREKDYGTMSAIQILERKLSLRPEKRYEENRRQR